MDHEDLAGWIERYERAWRTPGTAMLGELFAPGATYRASPFAPAVSGRSAIASFWEAEREGADEVFSMAWEPVAIEEDVGVVRVEVRYGGAPVRVYRDLWVVTLDRDGLCIAFEEWPFFPGRPRTPRDAEAHDRINR